MNLLFSGFLGAVIGAILTKMMDLRLDRVRKNWRQVELLVALHAEIVASLTKAKEQNQPKEQLYAKSDSTPFAMPDETDFVFESVKPDPSILPIGVIYPVIRYYKLAGQSNAQVKGLSEEAFRKDQDASGRKKYIDQLLELTKEQELAGLEALDAVEWEAMHRLDVSVSNELIRRRREVGITIPQTSKPAALLVHAWYHLMPMLRPEP